MKTSAGLAAILCAGWVAGAGAEDPLPAATPEAAPPAAEAPAGEATRGRIIEEIIVTAPKREENVREGPISMSVLHDECRVRGFGSPLSNKAFEQSVGLVIDGVAYGRREYFLGPLFDLERVEVLRGPQGTLFGKNTTA